MKAILCALLLAAPACVFVAAGAQAGEPLVVQGHPLKLKATLLSQGIEKVEKGKAKEKDIGALCTGQEKLQKGEEVIIVLGNACGGEGADLDANEIQVVQTDPYAELAGIGFIVCEDPILASAKNGTLKDETQICTVELCCPEELCTALDVQMQGVFETRFDKGGDCIQTLKGGNLAGSGSVGVDAVILDKGKIGAKKPDAALVAPAP